MWKSVFNELPGDGENVWIRVLSVYGQITKAKYVAMDQTFVVVEGEIIIPAYMVGRWKRE